MSSVESQPEPLLTNEQIYQRLTEEYQLKIGPVTGSTRHVYLKMLDRLQNPQEEKIADSNEAEYSPFERELSPNEGSASGKSGSQSAGSTPSHSPSRQYSLRQRTPRESDLFQINSRSFNKSKSSSGKKKSKDSDIWVVERIVGERTTVDGVKQYHVKWENWSTEDNTWEPIESFIDLTPVEVWTKAKESKLARQMYLRKYYTLVLFALLVAFIAIYLTAGSWSHWASPDALT